MRIWLQIVVCVGILAISAAAVAYTWQSWRIYSLERHAETICKDYIDKHAPRSGANVEKWLARRECINGVLGMGDFKTP